LRPSVAPVQRPPASTGLDRTMTMHTRGNHGLKDLGKVHQMAKNHQISSTYAGPQPREGDGFLGEDPAASVLGPTPLFFDVQESNNSKWALYNRSKTVDNQKIFF
jgi:hypothetical protein